MSGRVGYFWRSESAEGGGGGLGIFGGLSGLFRYDIGSQRKRVPEWEPGSESVRLITCSVLLFTSTCHFHSQS